MYQVGCRLHSCQQRPDLACLSRQYRYTVPKQDTIAGESRNAIPGRNDAGEIQRIRSAQPDQLSPSFQPANRSELSHRFGQRELFSGNAGDETAPSNFAACLEPAVDHQELAPGRRGWLPHQESLEDHPIPAEQGPGVQLG
jgi:hypothetical protein